MAVHRRGTTADSPQPRVSLGRVLVTIDDLRALVDLLEECSNQKEAPVIEFEGGTIDDPAEMRRLSDDELSVITVKNSDIEIILATNEAACYGSKSTADTVYKSWARARPSKITPKAARPYNRVGSWARLNLLVFPLLLVVMIASLVSMALDSEPDGISRIFFEIFGRPGAIIIASLLIVSVAISAIRKMVQAPADFAEIQPVTLEEYRKDDTARYRQIVTWLIATSAVAVSLLGVVLGLIFAR